MSGVLRGLGISPTSKAENSVGVFRVSGERAHGDPACEVYPEYVITLVIPKIELSRN